jgi:long-chain acyl-CoA synthetase
LPRDNVFPCYYRDEQATSGAFTADGWFRTGDLAEMDDSGWLRIKELIVTGAGVNVYPDGIEAELNRTEGVREGCVIGLDRGAGEEVHGVLLLDGSGSAGTGYEKESLNSAAVRRRRKRGHP